MRRALVLTAIGFGAVGPLLLGILPTGRAAEGREFHTGACPLWVAVFDISGLSKRPDKGDGQESGRYARLVAAFDGLRAGDHAEARGVQVSVEADPDLALLTLHGATPYVVTVQVNGKGEPQRMRLRTLLDQGAGVAREGPGAGLLTVLHCCDPWTE